MGGGPRLPRLAFVQEPDGFSTSDIAEAASDCCELVWVVDTTRPGLAGLMPLLSRLGEVIDVAGADEETAAAALGRLEPDGILTLSDSRLEWTARVACRLGLPAVSPETARRLTDKHAQRQALAEAGLAVPGFFAVPPLEDGPGWERLATEAGFPAVLKPRVGAGSRHIVLVDSVAAVALEVKAAAADPERAAVPFVLETYLPDAPGAVAAPFAGYVSVESVVVAGEVVNLAVTGRLPLAEPFRETGFVMPAALSGRTEGAVRDLAASAARALGVEIGFLHTEIKLTPAGPVVIEVNGRLGGGISKLAGLSAGCPLLPFALRLALGDPAGIALGPVFERVAFLLYLQAPASLERLVAVEGLDRLGEDRRVVQIVLNRHPGARLDWRDGNHGHVCSVLGTVADHAELAAFLGRVETGVVFVGA